MLPVNAARGRAATLRAGYGELLLLSAAAAASSSASSGNPSAIQQQHQHHHHHHQQSGTHNLSNTNNSAVSGPSHAGLVGQLASAMPNPSSMMPSVAGKTAGAGLQAAAALLGGNGLVSYRYAPYQIPSSAGGAQHSAAAAAAANEALAAASMAGLGLPINFSTAAGLYPFYGMDVAAAAAAAHQQAVQAAASKQRAGFLNLYGNLGVNGGNVGPNGPSASGSGNSELSLSSFAGLEGFYPVPVGL